MDEKLKAETIQWLTGIREAAEKASGFVVDQAPEVAREIILYGRIWYTGASVIAFAITIAFIVLTTMAVKECCKLGSSENGDGLVGCTLFMFFASTISVFAMLYHVGMATQAWVAPRLYVLQQLSELIKSAS